MFWDWVFDDCIPDVTITMENPGMPTGSMVSVDAANPGSIILDYSQGAFRENGITFIATIDATNTDPLLNGGLVSVRSDPIDIRAASTYVCNAYKGCVPFGV